MPFKRVALLVPSLQVEAFTALSSSLRAAAAGELEPHELPPGGPAGVARELEKVRERLLEALDDPHAKVGDAAAAGGTCEKAEPSFVSVLQQPPKLDPTRPNSLS